MIIWIKFGPHDPCRTSCIVPEPLHANPSLETKKIEMQMIQQMGINQVFTDVHPPINRCCVQIYVQVVWNEDWKSENLFPYLRSPGHDLLHHPRLVPGSPVTTGTSFLAR